MRKCVSKFRRYSIDYLKFGFTEEYGDDSKPIYWWCKNCLCNDPTRPGKVAEHFQNVHPEHADIRIFVRRKGKYAEETVIVH